MKVQDHYATLSIDRCASGAEIKRAYRTLAQRFHPDVTEDADGERKFKDVAEAYRTLKQPESRFAYDLQIHNFCDGRMAVRAASLLEMDLFNCSLILWCYWSWFWPIRARDAGR